MKEKDLLGRHPPRVYVVLYLFSAGNLLDAGNMPETVYALSCSGRVAVADCHVPFWP